MVNETHNDDSSSLLPLADPVVRPVTVSDIVESLADGMRDFQNAPVYGLTFGALYAVGGILIVIGVSALGASYLSYPLAAGFSLIGPLAAIGLYEVSRRRETGDPLSWSAVMGTTVAHRHELGSMGFAVVFVFVVWMYQVRLLIALMLGPKSFVSLQDFLLAVTTTPEGWIFLIVEHLIGAVLLFITFSVSVVSFPLLLDRNVDFVTAMITSVRAVVASPGPMIGWAAVIFLLLIVACLLGFLGLLVVLPVLGHATWHLYRRIVPRET